MKKNLTSTVYTNNKLPDEVNLFKLFHLCVRFYLRICRSQKRSKKTVRNLVRGWLLLYWSSYQHGLPKTSNLTYVRPLYKYYQITSSKFINY